MTVPNNNQKKRYSGNGATTVFAYDFKILDESHLEVVIADADDNSDTLTLSTDYTVSGVGESIGGNVTLGDLTSYTGAAALPSGWTVTINRKPPLTQLTDLSNQGGFFAETHEDAFDLRTMQILYLAEQLDRCLKVSLTSGDSGASLDEDFTSILASCQASQAAAEAAQTGAQTAQANAETAETNAETAETNAETAETNATAAQAAAEAARDAVVISVHAETASPAQTTIDISGSFTALDTAKPNIQVFIDGVRQTTASWTRTSDTVITLGGALSGGEAIEVLSATPTGTGTSHSHSNMTTLDAIPDHSAASESEVMAIQADGSIAWEAQSGSGSGSACSEAIAQAAHGLAVGEAVKHNGSAYAKAQADSTTNAEVVGIVSAVADVDNFTITYIGRVTGLSGLVAGSVYYLSASTAGAITATAPATSGQVQKPVLLATSTTSGIVLSRNGQEVA